jgi:5-methylcytosine-specific restriction endonuclease McrA
MIPMVVCNKCGEEWPRLVEYWPRERSQPDGLRKTCRKCRNDWKSENHKYRSENELGYRERHTERNRTNARRGGYDAKRNKDPKRKLQRKLRQHKRRYRQHNADGHCSSDTFEMILKSQRDCCYWCGDAFGPDNSPQVDHLTPLGRKGSNAPSNIVAACRSCNSSKGEKTAEEYIQFLCDKELHVLLRRLVVIVNRAIVPNKGEGK